MPFNEIPPSSSLTLEAVKIQFDHWRATRARGSRTPNHLWEAVQRLTKQYAYDQIAPALNINPHRLRARMEKQSRQSSALLKTDFVEVPLSPLTSKHPPSPELKAFKPDVYAPTALELARPDGLALKAFGLNHNDLLSLVKSFLGQ